MNFTDTDPRGDEFDDDETGCSGLLVLLSLLAAFALTAVAGAGRRKSMAEQDERASAH